MDSLGRQFAFAWNHSQRPVVARWYLLALAFGVVVHTSALRADEPTPAKSNATAEQIEFFEKKIRPVLTQHCAACHSAASQTQGQGKGGLFVDSRAGLLRGGDSGPAVVPGEPNKSLLLSALRYQDFEMPPKGKLPAPVIADFEQWIRTGAADPRTEEAAVRRPAIDIEKGRQHWAYRPLNAPRLAASAEPSWPRGPLDLFIQSGWRDQRLASAPDATAPAIVRRAAFDLLGLPPAREWIDEFQASDEPDRWSRLIDRLLASPHFGERWGRHWLDLARFAESITLRGFILPEAWRYRDYVVESFNRDLPYDEFLIEQVAGDLLPSDELAVRQRRRIATTFLVLGNTNLEEQDKKQLRMDVVDEQLETIGKAVLAQTLGCARCHDHKFDPIPTRDYYALAGILRSSKTLEHANVSKWLEFPLPVASDEEAIYQRHEVAVRELEKQIKTLKDQAKLVAAPGKDAATGPAIVSAKELPGIVLDDTHAKKVGEWKASQFTARYIGDGYVHDLDTGKGDKTLTFQPELPQAGSYEVRLAYTPGGNRATNVPVTVFSAEGEKTISVNEKETPPIDGRFISLGTYRFEMNGQGFVIVSNEGTNGHVIVDAVQFLLPDANGTAKADSAKSDSSKPATKPVAQNSEEREKATRDATIKRLEAELKQLTSSGPKRPMYMSVKEEDADELGDTQIHIRGVVHNLGETVPRGFLQVATVGAKPTIPAHESGRRELGTWLAARDNPLTARVISNRVWHWLFGAGIVRTTDNFGTTGESPSHPELLDYLATQLLERDWSVKSLVREVVLSRTYQLADQATPAALAADPENRWLARATRRRLDAESLLDSMLVVSGTLDEQLGGPSIQAGTAADYGYRQDSPRRALYWPVLRNALPDLFEAFDFADPSMVVGRRSTSTVAPQALFLMNHPFVLEQARRAAERLAQDLRNSEANAPNDNAPATQHKFTENDERGIELAYRRTLGRPPDDAERKLALDYLRTHSSDLESHRKAWAHLFQALFASIDFRYQ